VASEIGRWRTIIDLLCHEIRHVGYVIAGKSQREIKQAVVTEFVGAIDGRSSPILFLAATVALHGPTRIDPAIDAVVG
jgi:hypothetical protein